MFDKEMYKALDTPIKLVLISTGFHSNSYRCHHILTICAHITRFKEWPKFKCLTDKHVYLANSSKKAVKHLAFSPSIFYWHTRFIFVESSQIMLNTPMTREFYF